MSRKPRWTLTSILMVAVVLGATPARAQHRDSLDAPAPPADAALWEKTFYLSQTFFNDLKLDPKLEVLSRLAEAQQTCGYDFITDEHSRRWNAYAHVGVEQVLNRGGYRGKLAWMVSGEDLEREFKSFRDMAYRMFALEKPHQPWTYEEIVADCARVKDQVREAYFETELR